MAARTPKAEEKAFGPRGSALEVMYCKEPQVLLCGPAGTGKSRVWLEKLHLCAEKYPGMRGLILRQTRKSLSTTGLVTFEDQVLPVGHPAKSGAKRQQRSCYYYPNGSEIDVGGLDNPEKIMSSEYDFIFIQESTETLEDSVEQLTTRLRHGVMPYQQMGLDCNPASPNHYLKKKADSKALVYLESKFEDNPKMWNASTGTWTPFGASYIAILDKLTGARLQRLRYGKWSQPEGARFPQAIKEVQGFEAHKLWKHGIPNSYRKWLSMDYGKAKPYACLWHCMDFDGNIYTYREDYEAGLTPDVQAQRVMELSPENESYYVVKIDPAIASKFADNEGRGTKSAKDYYQAEFDKRPKQFGPIAPGFNKSRVVGYTSLDVLLNRNNESPNWFIDVSCVNLWKELEDITFFKSPSGVWSEDTDPKCADHAIDASVYGLHDTLYPPDEQGEEHGVVDYAKIWAARQMKEIEEDEQRASRSSGGASRFRI